MKQITVSVIDPVGLHARPATVAVNAASKFKCEVNVAFKGRESRFLVTEMTKMPQSQRLKKYCAHRKLSDKDRNSKFSQGFLNKRSK